MPYVLESVQDSVQEQEQNFGGGIRLPPAAAALQGVSGVLAATIRALASQGKSKASCNKPVQENGMTPCEQVKRLKKLQALRQRGH